MVMSIFWVVFVLLRQSDIINHEVSFFFVEAAHEVPDEMYFFGI